MEPAPQPEQVPIQKTIRITRAEVCIEEVGLGGFDKLKFPLVRKVFPNLVAQDLVSVQPMSVPSGSLFYLDYEYGTNANKPTFTPNNRSGRRKKNDNKNKASKSKDHRRMHSSSRTSGT